MTTSVSIHDPTRSYRKNKVYYGRNWKYKPIFTGLIFLLISIPFEGTNPVKFVKSRTFCKESGIICGAIMSQNIISLAQLESPKNEVERVEG